jgi:hypothetical protein
MIGHPFLSMLRGHSGALGSWQRSSSLLMDCCPSEPGPVHLLIPLHDIDGIQHGLNLHVKDCRLL